jgi:nucleoid DNA-binding protein
MNISAIILDYLKKYGQVAVPEFGVFSLENSRAVVDPETKTILPPAKQIVFETDYTLQSNNIVKIIAETENISAQDARAKLKTQTDYWKKMLQSGENFSVDELGDFFVSENQLVFKGQRIQAESPDFYGLEEIKIADLRNSAVHNHSSEEFAEQGAYRFNNSILWIFLLLLPVLWLAYLGITQQERLFGKKSFDDVSIKNSTHRIVKYTAKTDSLKQQTALADSLKKDSLNKTVAAPVKSTPKKWKTTKKWSSKNNKNKKWKAKKRQTR